jgi:nucleotide-binding universal stress UspA family protein
MEIGGGKIYERILVPLDGSQLAEVALPYAEELAGRLDSEVILIHVSESAEAPHYHMQQLYIEQTSEATKHGAGRYIQKPEGKAIKVESRVVVGSPAEEIVQHADKEDIGLIVMATHGRSGIRRWALGSVAAKVVKATKRPVALIRAKVARPDVREKGILNKALVPLDGSKESETVIPYIQELVSKLKAEIVVLHVLHIALGHEINMTEQLRQLQSLRAPAEAYIERVAAQLEEKGIRAEVLLREVTAGTVAEQIIRVADEVCADLVAMSTHGLSGVGRWPLGSVADKVLHAGNTPLLLVRALGARAE